MKAHLRKLFLAVAVPLLVCAILMFFFTSLSNLNADKALEDKQQLETALARAAVACYATEGAYPVSLEYLVENYGVQIDTERYTVIYDIFASNLMPDITVLEN